MRRGFEVNIWEWESAIRKAERTLVANLEKEHTIKLESGGFRAAGKWML